MFLLTLTYLHEHAIYRTQGHLNRRLLQN